MARYSVLTYIFGGYDTLHEIVEKDKDAEYILVTDDKSLTSSTWNVVYDDTLTGLSVFDKCYKVRFNPFKYCSSDICLRIDGSFVVKKSLKDIIDEFETGNYDMSLMIHPVRNNMISEYQTWIKYRNYDINQANKCLNVMRSFGYDFKYKGLYQCGFVIQRKNQLTDDVNSRTFFLLKMLGKDGNIERIDQTIFSFVLNSEFNHINVMPVSETLITDSEYLSWCDHSTNEPIPPKKYTSTPFLFNKPCTIKHFVNNSDNVTIQWEKYFDAIYCLSLADNIEKRSLLEKELSRVGILNSKIFRYKITVKNELYKYICSAPELNIDKYLQSNPQAFNTTLGHYEIMKECLAMGYKRVLILEDDVRFLKNIKEMYDILENIPEECDICLFDKFVPFSKEPYLNEIKTNKINTYFFNFEKIKLWSCGCYALSQNAMKTIVSKQVKKFVSADESTNKVNNDGVVVNDDNLYNLYRVSAIKNLCVQDRRLKEQMKPIDYHLYDDIVNLNDYYM